MMIRSIPIFLSFLLPTFLGPEIAIPSLLFCRLLVDDLEFVSDMFRLQYASPFLLFPPLAA